MSSKPLGASHVCLVSGPAGAIDLAIDPAFGGKVPAPAEASVVRGIALVAHPHPLFGGTRDNKVVMTMARALTAQGFHVLRPNFRGVGDSEGVHDEGRGESEDMQVLAQACMGDAPPAWWPEGPHWAWPARHRPLLAGFSFGAFVQTRVRKAMALDDVEMILVGVAVSRFDAAPVPAGTLVIHGEEDDVVALSDVLDWARPQTLPVVVVPGTGHFFHGCLVTLKKIVTDFVLSRYNTPNALHQASGLNEGDRDA